MTVLTPRQPEPPTQTALTSDSVEKPPRLLIVDDNPVDRDLVTRLLRQQFGDAIELQEVDNGQSALEVLSRGQTDLALIDYLLPDMDGLELLREIDATSAEIGCILMTGQGSETVAAQAIKRGARDYLIKGDLTPEVFRRTIQKVYRALSLERRNAALDAQLRAAHEELDYLVQALSHDMSANFMVLDSSFRQLKKATTSATTPATGLPDDLIDHLGHVEACLRESRRFLGDLVSLGKTGSIDMEPDTVELSSLVEEVLFEQSSLLAERGIEVEVDDRLPRVHCNAQRVKQVLTNLLRNAAKHGCDPEEPRIAVRYSQSDPRDTPGGFACLRLEDNGTGIPDEFREQVFLPGRRLRGSGASGSGMGLAIVKKIVTHYGGTVYVETPAAGGTAMVFSLPKAARNDVAAEPTATPVEA